MAAHNPAGGDHNKSLITGGFDFRLFDGPDPAHEPHL